MAKLEINSEDDFSYVEPWKYLLLQRSHAMSNAYGTVPSILPFLNALEAMQVLISHNTKLLLSMRLLLIHN